MADNTKQMCVLITPAITEAKCKCGVSSDGPIDLWGDNRNLMFAAAEWPLSFFASSSHPKSSAPEPSRRKTLPAFRLSAPQKWAVDQFIGVILLRKWIHSEFTVNAFLKCNGCSPLHHSSICLQTAPEAVDHSPASPCFTVRPANSTFINSSHSCLT